eukprot:5561572-Pleurochrysis_carterae.AAC.1
MRHRQPRRHNWTQRTPTSSRAGRSTTSAHLRHRRMTRSLSRRQIQTATTMPKERLQTASCAVGGKPQQ